MPWQDLARCATHGDPDDFHPEYNLGRPDAAVLAALARAKAVCAACPVCAACLDTHRREPFGVWGGTTPPERGFHAHPRRHRRRNTTGPGCPGPEAERAESHDQPEGGDESRLDPRLPGLSEACATIGARG